MEATLAQLSTGTLGMVLPPVLLVVGFALLIWGADRFVLGASVLARSLGVSPLLVGLTVVAFGTSAPELAVSATAALKGANEIAVGNVLGSNLFNLLVVGGFSAILSPLVMDKTLLRRDWPISFAAAAVMLAMIVQDNAISRADGLLLLLLFAIVMFLQIKSAVKQRRAGTEQDDARPALAKPTMLAYIVLGLICIVVGGDTTVNAASAIATRFGMSDTLIGLTIVALGTSLPELVTSAVAARRGENEIAMGNIIGSNLFNILLILGLSATISPIAVRPTAAIDTGILLAATAVCYLPAQKGRIGRRFGAVMLLGYAAYMVYLIWRSTGAAVI